MQVLDLLVERIIDIGSPALLITHDLGVVANYCDRVSIMHAGRVVEAASVEDFFARPFHPYSVGLLNAQRRSQIGHVTIRGSAPDASALPSGCSYHERCSFATELCVRAKPEPREIEPAHWTECHHAEQLQELQRAASG
jgi:peptide/nickel transport system ATP-binding protein